MWKYEVSNTDHTLMQGVELVNRLLLGEPRTTIGIKYAQHAPTVATAVHARGHRAVLRRCARSSQVKQTSNRT